MLKIKLFSRTLSPGLSTLSLYSLYVIFTVLSIVKFSILSENFFYDADIIKRYISAGTFSLYSSYGGTSFLYSLIPLGSNEHFIAVTSMLICIAILHKTLSNINTVDTKTLFIATLYLLLSSIFLAQHSKDFWVIFISFLFTKISKDKALDLSILFAILAYGILLRNYWILILALYISNTLIYLKFRKKIAIIAFSTCYLLALSFFFESYLGIHLTAYRDQVNLTRVSDTATIITNYISPTSPITAWANAMITWLLIILPLPLLTIGEARHFISFFIISFVFFTIFRHFLKEQNPKKVKILIFIISYTFIQSIFEPDYGSVLRHLSPLLILIIYAANTSFTNAQTRATKGAPTNR